MTQIGIQFILQILLPGFFIYELFRKRYPNRWEWLVKVCVFGLTLLFAFLTARWDWFSYYLRLLLPLLFVVAGYIAYRNIDPAPPSTSKKPSWTRYLFDGILIVVVVWLNANALKGYFYPEVAVDLSYPLKGAVYYVGGGGNSRWINNHNAFPPQDYALDILRLNALGNRALGLWPEELSQYAIYEDAIYSPCTGRIVRAIDGHPDQTPPSKDRSNLAGNHVIIACHGVEVVMAHMMQGSVVVQRGDTVQEGEVIGRVGNSGNTTQPHLHIHVEQGGPSGEIFEGEGVPIMFNGRFLVRSSLFSGK